MQHRFRVPATSAIAMTVFAQPALAGEALIDAVAAESPLKRKAAG